MTAASCTDPLRRDALLEAEVRGVPYDQDLLKHLHACLACRRETERLRRMRDVWAKGAPDDWEVLCARARFRAQPRRRRARATLLLGVGLIAATAAAGVLRMRADPWHARATEMEIEIEGGLASHAGTATPQEVSTSSTRAAEQQAQDVAATGDNGRAKKPSDALPAGKTNGQRAKPSREGKRTKTPAVSGGARPGNKPAEAQATLSGEEAIGAWTRVATALRADDSEGAEQALEPLIRSADPTTRDAARLTQAELQVSQGRRTEATEALRSLSHEGATPLVRRRAREILDEQH